MSSLVYIQLHLLRVDEAALGLITKYTLELYSGFLQNAL